MKRFATLLKISLVISILIIGQLLFFSTSFAQQHLAFGIAKPGGTFYTLGAGFANIFNKYVPEVQVTGESTAGSTENVNLLSTKQLDLGFAGSAYYLSAKERGLDLSNLRLISAGYVSSLQWIVREESPIKSIKDFVGKRIAVGSVGSGTLESSKLALEVGYGISFDDIKAVYIGKGETANALRDKAVDAIVSFAHVPSADAMDISSTTAVRIIPFDKEAAEKIYQKYPAYPVVTIPKGAYKFLKDDVLAIGTPCLFLVSAELEEDLVYKIVKVLYEHQEEKDAIMPAAKDFNLENVFRGTENLELPFHTGAIKYYKEKGIWK